MTPSQGWRTKAKEASPHEVRLALLETNPEFEMVFWSEKKVTDRFDKAHERGFRVFLAGEVIFRNSQIFFRV